MIVEAPFYYHIYVWTSIETLFHGIAIQHIYIYVYIRLAVQSSLAPIVLHMGNGRWASLA